MYGDGYVFYDKKSRHYQIEFYLNSESDKEIITFIDNLFKKIGLNTYIYKDKRFNCVRVRAYSKNFMNS